MYLKIYLNCQILKWKRSKHVSYNDNTENTCVKSFIFENIACNCVWCSSCNPNVSQWHYEIFPEGCDKNNPCTTYKNI